MSPGALRESAIRVSDCVTGLLQKQPFFGSLVLRLPLRADPTRKTLASDGHEIRYSPGWVAETDAHLIETAMARVVMACALKHHTRRGERDPERWQTASQLVTHALLRDAGFTLPPEAEAWEDLSVDFLHRRFPTGPTQADVSRAADHNLLRLLDNISNLKRTKDRLGVQRNTAIQHYFNTDAGTHNPAHPCRFTARNSEPRCLFLAGLAGLEKFDEGNDQTALGDQCAEEPTHKVGLHRLDGCFGFLPQGVDIGLVAELVLSGRHALRRGARLVSRGSRSRSCA